MRVRAHLDGTIAGVLDPEAGAVAPRAQIELAVTKHVFAGNHGAAYRIGS